MTAVRLADVVKAYDVRGLVPEQLSPQVATTLGTAFAQVVVLPEGERGVVIGHDMRDSSPELARAFAAGVVAQGVDVTMVGLCSTDGLYHASGSLGLAGAMFTASHNPARYNGIKLCRSAARPVGQDSGLTEIRDLAQWLLDRGDHHPPMRAAVPGTITETDLLDDYAAYLRSLVDLRGGRPLTVVVDAGNGMAGLTVPAVLQRGDLPLTVVPLYFELDGTFPHHEANPLEPENLRDLQAAVLAHGADLGLAFDGDADRCVVVDERGEPVSPSAVTALVAEREIRKEVASGRPAAEVTVVHNLITSRAVGETVDALGARAVRTRVGHSFVKAQMAEHEAVFGGEHSAHYYFREFWYADTGMLAALHVLAALGEQDAPMSSLVERFDRYSASGEINSTVADVAAATERVRAWAQDRGAVADTLDGLTMSREDDPVWWFSLRPSNTEPLLRLNVEAADRTTMEQVRDDVLGLVRQEP
ncbi:phosphomannomutase/phosphoglucomutase [Ornithinimicrobium tianjinense]|uniref:phosphomannomutase/phosphoglucomutase n=1 Tax=Ornithinimicrobium tianjinense TaxID=1195761 RepID=UPI001664D091|nr:phosphomannomutase/phosphoglucomutase [Ornithinimicrobium tianjinense]